VADTGHALLPLARGRELQLTLATVPGRLADPAERRRLLAWLTGRAGSPGDLDLGRWESRPGNYFMGIST
jgi:hypothetical protein